jgi:hypothetical protein
MIDINPRLLNALHQRLAGEIATARANIDIYMTSPVGIGEHPDIIGSIETLFGVIAEAQDKIDAIKQYERDIVIENKNMIKKKG